MFASLIPTQRTKVANNNVIGELVIRMPMLDEFGEEVIDGEYKNVVFLVPVVMTVHELRRRIAGEVNLPLKTLHLYLKGSLLDSDEVAYVGWM